jgi:hypothetical protein
LCQWSGAPAISEGVQTEIPEGNIDLQQPEDEDSLADPEDTNYLAPAEDIQQNADFALPLP